MPGRTVASTIKAQPPIEGSDDFKRSLHEAKREQRVKENGVFRTNHVEIQGDNNGIAYEVKKAEGSKMFPSDWTAEDVIRSVIETSHTAPVRLSSDGASSIHEHEVGGVKVRVVTDTASGKIVSGYPK